MIKNKIVFLVIGTYIWTSVLSAQTVNNAIFRDVKLLIGAGEAVNMEALLEADTTAIKAAATVWAILEEYDIQKESDGILNDTWNGLTAKYAKNTFITELVPAIRQEVPEDIALRIKHEAEKIISDRTGGPRQEILADLFSGTASSPAEYLSVNNTLEKYKKPVLLPMQAMQLSAAGSNRNIIDNGLITQANIISGLFMFVLDRAKDEVIINFLDRLVNKETPEFQLLFPTVITEFRNTDFSYSNSFIGRLREAFYEDVQKLTVRLPLLMLQDEYFRPLQADPVAYNLLTLYSMIGLAQFGMPVEEVLPKTNRYLFSSYEEATKEVNLILAETAYASGQYQALITQTETVLGQMKDIYLALYKAEIALDNGTKAFRQRFPNAPPAPNLNDFLAKPDYQLGVLFGEDQKYSLNLVPQLLRGQLDSTYIMGYNTVDDFDRLFGAEQTPQQRRAAGLELVKKLNGVWHNDQSMAEIFRAWQRDLTRAGLAVDKWMQQVDFQGVMLRALRASDRKRERLATAIVDDKMMWKPRLNQEQKLMFDFLANLISPENFGNTDDLTASEFFKEHLNELTEVSGPLMERGIILDPSLKSLSSLPTNDLPGEIKGKVEQLQYQLGAAKLDRRTNLLLSVEKRVLNLDTTLYSRHPKQQYPGPLQTYMNDRETASPYAQLVTKIDSLQSSLVGVQDQLKLLERTFAASSSRARDNARPALQTTRLATDLLYCFRNNDLQEKWLSPRQLDTLLDGKQTKVAFLGLIHQRLTANQQVSFLSADGLSSLAQMTIIDLHELQPKDTAAVRDTMGFYRKAAFAVNTLNRILELPLVADPQQPRHYTSLIKRSPKLEKIPEISNQALDFIYYINIKDHSKAISSLIRLFTNLDLNTRESLAIQKGKKPGTGKSKRKELLHYLQKYGDFIADLIDARHKNEVKTILEEIADPPGSSRIKRTHGLTVGINAYLGVTYGREIWNGDDDELDRDFSALAPTMPIGFAVSWLQGKKHSSFSAFVSLLDIGSLFTYQPSSNKAIASDLTFKNVFKPGLQLHWNIPKSPFYLGAGWQYGPQYQTFNGRQTSVEAHRYFFGLGIDVPIKTLYQR
ncbi:MAG: hypothetical protein R2824_05205 [Saprospiraceae bacterium]|nr:hypothetical protein [Lewinella sp.]